MKTLRILFILCTCSGTLTHAQTLVPLSTDVSVKKLMNIRLNAVRIVHDKLSGSFYYNTSEGNIYRINSDYTDELIYTVADHGVEFLMGFNIRDSAIYLAGNNNSATPFTTGLVVKGKLQPDGSRKWNTVVKTAPYETVGVFDHMVSGLTLTPKGDTILFSNGSRGDHGEINTHGGQFPGLRNTPLTTVVFCVPADTTDLVLLHDSAWLAASGFIYVRGDRNFFDMAWCANGDLFATENSADRDHNEEMNWLRRGRHYGFPWVMGETVNIAQFPWYDYTKDKLLPITSYAKAVGMFKPDSTFPPPPHGIVFTDPVINLGPDADKFRDTATGLIYDASDMGIGLKTFTAHRSPLGLVFDNDSLMGGIYTGHAFLLSYTKGNMDSTKAFPPNNVGGPFLDPSEDLLHLELEKDPGIDNYRMHATRIVAGFRGPVDAEIIGNKIYVIENQFDSTKASPALWEVTLPARPKQTWEAPLIFPNPAINNFIVRLHPVSTNTKIELFDMQGRLLSLFTPQVKKNAGNDVKITVDGLQEGMYLCRITDGATVYLRKVALISSP